jgi:hypothetical protein
MSVSEDREKAREQIELHVSADARGYGGRRIGFLSAQEREQRMALEERLLQLARRAVRNDNLSQ